MGCLLIRKKQVEKSRLLDNRAGIIDSVNFFQFWCSHLLTLQCDIQKYLEKHWLVWILPQGCYEKLYKHNENKTGNVILVALPQQKLMDNSLGLTCSLTSSLWTVRSNFSIIFKIDFKSSSYSKRFKDCNGVFAVRKFSSSKTHSFVRGKSSHFKTPMRIILWIYNQDLNDSENLALDVPWVRKPEFTSV